uniref:Uncharacterized protein n=1 Tax=Cannabis sativa TaxID=3483 RepID=A0A803PGH0_CANSA
MRRRSATSVPSEQMEKGTGKNQHNRLCCLVALSAFFWILLLYFHFAVLGRNGVDESVKLQPVSVDNIDSSVVVTHVTSGSNLKFPIPPKPTRSVASPRKMANPPPKVVTQVHEKEAFPFMKAMRTIDNKSDPCGGRYIYVHELPSRFNEDMLKECRSLSLWTNMCKFTTNAGLGPPLENVEGVFRYRDAASLDLVDWLMKRPEWDVMGGKDHFLVAGRITWDLRRLSEEESDWGNKLLFLPAAKNMSMLVVESSPWNANDFGIPYPTYFHPAKDEDVFVWQDRMRKLERKWLFSFAGAPRPDNPKSIRGQIIDQCKRSKVGKLLECDFGESKCHLPSSIMQMFQSSLFCLQPQGDSYTRRSAFDSMLAGCIPVFFHPGSAYTQYTWHLPKNYTKYSVFIPEDDIRKRNISIEERLLQIPPEQVKIMRENVISLIPTLVYADPRSKLETLKDAFDVSVQAIIDKVTNLRRDIIEGHTDENFIEENSWKYALLEEGQREVGPHEWDPFFSKPKGENSESTDKSAEVANTTTLQTYIVQLHSQGMASSLFTTKLNWHISFLEQSISSDDDEEQEQHPSSRLVYSYNSALKVPKMERCVNKAKTLTPQVVIGSSLARFFIRGHKVASSSTSASVPESVMEYVSPRDSHGHGSHTTSTAGGASVAMANVLGNGAGVARGIAPYSHVAAYKVCWYNGCYSSDILAAMDAAISDGVDVLSLSRRFSHTLFADSIAIGSFRAMEHGITVVCAAGNNGPIESSVANEAPWVATIGASTMDRKFPAVVQMGNGQTLYGESLYPGNRISGSQKKLEIVYVNEEQGSRFCLKGSLPKAQVSGKMVVCDRGVNGRSEKGQAVLEAGGLAMILTNTELNLEEDSVDVHVLPATLVGFDESIVLKTYINSTRRPMGRIKFGGTIIGKSEAPGVAQFSGRGPSFSNPSILKPDVIAPGVNIIAAWPQNLGPSGLPEDSRRVNFTVMSGTSMACPHVSGIAALIRSAHPKWSPAAVKSAIMTTADVTDHSGKPIMDWDKPAGVFAVGAGHVNPIKALDPGLVYDTKPDEYVTHLCTLGYTTSEVFSVTHKNVSCHQILMMNKGFSLNYPSISVIFKHGMRSKMIKRRVTNVGSPNSIYSLEIEAPQGVKVIVKPKRLRFRHKNQVLNYKVWFISRKRGDKDSVSYAQGHLTWVNNAHRVRSPISVTWKKQNDHNE